MSPVKWRFVAQEYVIQNGNQGTYFPADPRTYGALFIAEVSGGFLLKTVSKHNASTVFIPESPLTQDLSSLPEARSHFPMYEGNEQLAREMDEAGTQKRDQEKWLLRFLDKVSPDRKARDAAGESLMAQLLECHGKYGIEATRGSSGSSESHIRLRLPEQDPVNVHFNGSDFFIEMPRYQRNEKVGALTYDAASKSFRAGSEEGPAGLPALLQAAWEVIQGKKGTK